MNLKVIFEKKAGKDFEKGWGIAYLINETLLFDTGEKFSYLENNFKKMNIDLNKIEKILISHSHWDHIGGLEELFQKNSQIKLYIPSHTDEYLKKKWKNFNVIEVEENIEIIKGVFSTGESLVNYKGELLAEQSLAIVGEKIILVCGCCHLGILNLVEKVKDLFKKEIKMIIGGLHFMDKEKRFIHYIAEKLLHQVEFLKLGHCTGYEGMNILREIFKDKIEELVVGETIEL